MSRNYYPYPKFKSEERCRFCVHYAMAHMEIKNFGAPEMMGKWDKCIMGVTDQSFQARTCPCPGFAPQGNLEYLEWQHETKQTL